MRTILAVDHAANSLTFAGDVPEGWTAISCAGILIASRRVRPWRRARRAAAFGTDGDSLAVMISCIGRRLLMGQRITDEIEAALREFRLARPPSASTPMARYRPMRLPAIASCTTRP